LGHADPNIAWLFNPDRIVTMGYSLGADTSCLTSDIGGLYDPRKTPNSGNDVLRAFAHLQ
jgi:hypothetical protein